MNCSAAKGFTKSHDYRAETIISVMFGLPLSTAIIAFGIPLLLAAALFWWGLRYPPKMERSREDAGDPDQ